ncbi:unnamed protein product [Caretta caretta]
MILKKAPVGEDLPVLRLLKMLKLVPLKDLFSSTLLMTYAKFELQTPETSSMETFSTGSSGRQSFTCRRDERF